MRGERLGLAAAHIDQRASERVFVFENAVKYFGGATFRKTRLQYMIMRKKYAYLSGIEGFWFSLFYVHQLLSCLQIILFSRIRNSPSSTVRLSRILLSRSLSEIPKLPSLRKTISAPRLA